MTNKTKKSYLGLFKFIRDHFNINPEIVMSDFEKAARKAARRIWPNARIAGCNFHFNQALTRHAKSIPILRHELKTNGSARFALKLFHRMSLIPEQHLREGKNVIREFLRRKNLNLAFRVFWR